MLKLKVVATSNVTDLGYCQRRIEALGFKVVRFGNELVVTEGLNHMTSDGFRLAELLRNNSPLLIEYTHSDENEKKWREQDDRIKHTDTLTNEKIRTDDPT